MAITTREVLATWYKPNGELAVDEPIVYHLVPGSYAANGMIPTGAVEDTTNDVAQTSTVLWTNSEGLTPTKWVVTNPKGEQHRFVLEPGDDPALLEDLLHAEDNYPWREDLDTEGQELVEASVFEKLANTIDAVLGDALVGSRYEPGGSGRTVHDRLADIVSVFDFIPTAEHEAIRDGSSNYDCVADIQRGVDQSAADGRTIAFPPGRYILRSQTGLDREVRTLLFQGLSSFRILFQPGAQLVARDGCSLRVVVIFRNCHDFVLEGANLVNETTHNWTPVAPTPAVPGAGSGFAFENCQDYIVRDCESRDFSRYGFVASEDTSAFQNSSLETWFQANDPDAGARGRINNDAGAFHPTTTAGPLPGEHIYLAGTLKNNGFVTAYAVGKTGAMSWIEVCKPGDAGYTDGDLVIEDEPKGQRPGDTATSAWFRMEGNTLAVRIEDPSTYLYFLNDGDYFEITYPDVGTGAANNHLWQIQTPDGMAADARSLTVYQTFFTEDPAGAYPITVTRMTRPLVQVWKAETHGNVTFDRCRSIGNGIYGYQLFPKALSGTLRVLHCRADRCGLLNAAGSGIKGGTNFSAVQIVSPRVNKCNYSINLGNFRATTVENPHITNGYGVGIAITTSSHLKAPLYEYGSLVIRGGYIGYTNDPDDPEGKLFHIPVKVPDVPQLPGISPLTFSDHKPAISLNGLIEDIGLLEITGMTIYKWGANAAGYGHGGIQFNKATVASTNIKIHHNKVIDAGGYLTNVLEKFHATLTDGSDTLTNVINEENASNPSAGWIAGIGVVGAGIPVGAHVIEVIKGAQHSFKLDKVCSGPSGVIKIRSAFPKGLMLTDNEFSTDEPKTTALVEVGTDSGMVSGNTITGFGQYPLRLICSDVSELWAMNNRIESPNRGAPDELPPVAPLASGAPVYFGNTVTDMLGTYRVYRTTVQLSNPAQAASLFWSNNCARFYTGDNIYPGTMSLVNSAGGKPAIIEGDHYGPRTWYHNAAPVLPAVPGQPIGPFQIGDRIINTAPTVTKAISEWRCATAGDPGGWIAIGNGRGTTATRPALLAGDHEYRYYDNTLLREAIWNGGTLLWTIPYEPRALFRARNSATVSGAEATMVPSGTVGSLALPADYFKLGSMVRFELAGSIRTGTGQTLQIKITHGTGPSLLVNTGAVAMPTMGTPFGSFKLTALIVCRVAGATGQLETTMQFSFTTAAGTVQTPQVIDVAPSLLSPFDTTVAGTLGVLAAWSPAGGNQSLITQNMLVEDIVI